MPISVKTSRGEGSVDEGSFRGFLRDISRKLKSGMPVMFLNYSQNNICGRNRYAQRYLFFSDGELSSDGVFGVEQGNRNFNYLTINENNPDSYQLVKHWKGQLDNHPISVPRNWTVNQYNEETFSPAGGSSWISNHSGGTEEVIVGKWLEKKFPSAITALRFARDAVFFHLPQVYSMQNYLITETGDKDTRNENEGQRTKQTSRVACVRACLNLLNEAERELEGYHGGLVARQAGWYNGGAKEIRDRLGYPVDDSDFVVGQISHPSKTLAFVKCEGVFQYGDIYILPTKKNQGLVEHAFSKKKVKRFYPHGLDD